MNISIQSLPGCRVNEYMLVLNPHEELRNKITKLRNEFSETYKNSAALISKPHIGAGAVYATGNDGRAVSEPVKGDRDGFSAI